MRSLYDILRERLGREPTDGECAAFVRLIREHPAFDAMGDLRRRIDDAERKLAAE